MKPRISSSCVRTTKSFVVVVIVVIVFVLQPRMSTSFSRIDFQRSCQHRICHPALKKAAESKTLATFQIKSSSIIPTRENKSIETIETTAGTSSTSTGI